MRKFQAKYSTNCCAMFPGAKGIAAGCDNASYEFFDIGSNCQVAAPPGKRARRNAYVTVAAACSLLGSLVRVCVARVSLTCCFFSFSCACV